MFPCGWVLLKVFREPLAAHHSKYDFVQRALLIRWPSPQHEFESVQGALDLLVQLDLASLGHAVHGLARGAEEAHRPDVDELHVPIALAAQALQGGR